MLKLSKDMTCAECDERKVEAPRSNFTTQGVPSSVRSHHNGCEVRTNGTAPDRPF
jgi:hypothetical protein